MRFSFFRNFSSIINCINVSFDWYDFCIFVSSNNKNHLTNAFVCSTFSMRFVCVNFSNHLRDMMHSHLFFVESTLFLDIDENDSRARLWKRDASENERETNETKENKTKKNERKRTKRQHERRNCIENQFC